MTVLDYENVFDVTTELRGVAVGSVITQSNPVTRRMYIDALAGEIETVTIERNAEFHSTIVARLGVADPVLVDADDLM